MTEIVVEMVREPIEAHPFVRPPGPSSGATLEFRGIVRNEEGGARIEALRYEAYESMARVEIRRIIDEETKFHPCERVGVLHRHGWIGVGEIAILVWIESRHRAEAFTLLENFMNRLKRDVPIWKVDAR